MLAPHHLLSLLLSGSHLRFRLTRTTQLIILFFLGSLCILFDALNVSSQTYIRVLSSTFVILITIAICFKEASRYTTEHATPLVKYALSNF